MDFLNSEEKFDWKRFVVVLGLSCLFAGGIMGVVIYYATKPPSTEPLSFTSNTQTTKDFKIKGNKNSKIYHLPRCPNYNDIAERNIIWFKTEEEAENAGFRMARNC